MQIPTARPRNVSLDQASMTPLIDIVFQLLIFFVCATTGHLREFLLPTDLAGGGTPSAAPERPDAPLSQVWIRLKVEGNSTVIEIEGSDYRPGDDVRQVLIPLAEAAPEVPLILEIAGNVPLGEVVSLVDLCRAAGFESIHFAAEPPENR